MPVFIVDFEHIFVCWYYDTFFLPEIFFCREAKDSLIQSDRVMPGKVCLKATIALATIELFVIASMTLLRSLARYVSIVDFTQTITHLMPMFRFYTPWKKPLVFWRFQGV